MAHCILVREEQGFSYTFGFFEEDVNNFHKLFFSSGKHINVLPLSRQSLKEQHQCHGRRTWVIAAEEIFK